MMEEALRLTAITLRSIADTLEKLEELGSVQIKEIKAQGHLLSLESSDSQTDGRTVFVTNIQLISLEDRM